MRRRLEGSLFFKSPFSLAKFMLTDADLYYIRCKWSTEVISSATCRPYILYSSVRIIPLDNLDSSTHIAIIPHKSFFSHSTSRVSLSHTSLRSCATYSSNVILFADVSTTPTRSTCVPRTEHRVIMLKKEHYSSDTPAVCIRHLTSTKLVTCFLQLLL